MWVAWRRTSTKLFCTLLSSPFGDIKDVNIPMDNTTGKHRGFGFVEYENAEVSTDAWVMHLALASSLTCHPS